MRSAVKDSSQNSHSSIFILMFSNLAPYGWTNWLCIEKFRFKFQVVGNFQGFFGRAENHWSVNISSNYQNGSCRLLPIVVFLCEIPQKNYNLLHSHSGPQQNYCFQLLTSGTIPESVFSDVFRAVVLEVTNFTLLQSLMFLIFEQVLRQIYGAKEVSLCSCLYLICAWEYYIIDQPAPKNSFSEYCRSLSLMLTINAKIEQNILFECTDIFANISKACPPSKFATHSRAVFLYYFVQSKTTRVMTQLWKTKIERVTFPFFDLVIRLVLKYFKFNGTIL